MKYSILALTAALTMTATASFAQDTDKTGFGLNAGVSTLGATIEPTWRITDSFGMRAPIGYASADFDGEIDGDQYNGDVDLGGFGLVADYYPMKGAFHLSAGLFKTDYAATLRHDASYGGMSTTLVADVSQKKDIMPYLGLGYEKAIGKRLTLSLDGGALFGKGFNVDGYDTNGFATQAQIDAEFSDLRDTMNDIKVIPYVKVAVGYRF